MTLDFLAYWIGYCVMGGAALITLFLIICYLYRGSPGEGDYPAYDEYDSDQADDFVPIGRRYDTESSDHVLWDKTVDGAVVYAKREDVLP